MYNIKMNAKIIQGYTNLINETNTKIKSSELDAKTKTGLRFKINHYRKALKKVKELGSEITLESDLKAIGNFTKSEIEHIKKFLESDIVVNNAEVQQSKELDLLQTVTGIGPKKAQDLLTIHKLKLSDLLSGKGSDLLTHHQLMGIKYYHDLNERIPRAEITKMKSYMSKQLSDGFKLEVCGSYRRKNKTSGDMDVLIFNPSVEDISKSIFFSCFIEKLTNRGFLVDSLTPNDSSTKYMGMCKLSPEDKVRRIDIRFIPASSVGSAMLYFTGSGEFNKNMRSYAIKLGYKLNEYGLFKKSGERVPTTTEKDIFDVLKVQFLEPDQRTKDVKFK